MKPAQKFEDLIVWQKAHQLVLEIYKLTLAFPKSEIYGLTSQIRRASVSVPANIAEGFKKRGPKDKVRYLNIAQGSLEEVRYYFILVNALGYADTKGSNELLIEVSKLLTSYSKSIINSIT